MNTNVSDSGIAAAYSAAQKAVSNTTCTYSKGDVAFGMRNCTSPNASELNKTFENFVFAGNEYKKLLTTQLGATQLGANNKSSPVR